MGRKKRYKSNAERQAAYRERKRKEQAHHEAVVVPLANKIIFGNEAGDLSDFKGPDPK